MSFREDLSSRSDVREGEGQPEVVHYGKGTADVVGLTSSGDEATGFMVYPIVYVSEP